MTEELPAEAYPFQHTAIEDAGFSDPLKIAYTHSDVTIAEASLGSTEYIETVRQRLGVECPSCVNPTVEPTDTSYTARSIAEHVTCTTCDWQGTRGAIERQQFAAFTEYGDETRYKLWNAFGDVTGFAGASRGVLKRETRSISGVERPIEEREAVVDALPSALQPTPPALAERFSVDEEAVEEGVEMLRETTPYDKEKLRAFVAESYTVQEIEPNSEELALAQTGNGRIAGAFARRPLTATDERRIEQGYSEIREALATYVGRTMFATQRETVIALRAGFEPVLQRRLRSDIIAEAVECNESYAAEFELVSVRPFPIVLKKEHVARREMDALTRTMRETVKERDGHTCVRCQSVSNLEVHHIIPVAQGGATNLANLATLCEECHEAAHGGSYGPTVVYPSQDAFWNWIGEEE